MHFSHTKWIKMNKITK